ncbi:DUF4167 domain-containing protein [Primorskyibacter aestuariivivens]|uniref:DUF4167 domain-containing protein n=1 Tax=Primorskyibacter aestuariivivens TaxID=1888912 RepID=UPI002300AB4B|nr:DUF4167 domain-containing protein [Primorskyibacter aestuariivivens]MDA7430585.1 DUF4167 domain-containing protein [Primorskyibacter aestuariivivens]
MRSSKSRSRSRSNRNKPSSGNIINRVFDSSGPEGKVRGTPQQIIDKYNQLARDAQLSGDRVATENFQQHAEHYTRMLSEAQKEQDAKREEQERQNRERQAQRDRERADRQERESNGGGGNDSSAQEQAAPRRDSNADLSEAPQPDVIDLDENGENTDSGLVDTPEERAEEPKPKPRRKSAAPRKSSKPKAAKKDDKSEADTPSSDEPSQAAE